MKQKTVKAKNKKRSQPSAKKSRSAAKTAVSHKNLVSQPKSLIQPEAPLPSPEPPIQETEPKQTEAKSWPPFRPAAYFGGNILLNGLSYLLLRQYARFFIFYGLVLVIVFVPLSNFFTYVLVLASAVDAYIIAKKLRNKEIPEPEFNMLLMIIVLLIWILAIGYFIYLIATQPML